MSVSKQLAMNFSVHGINLPIEVIDIIRSFVFEDRIVASVKRQMRVLMKTIDDASVSRKNSCNHVNDTTQNWEFQVSQDSNAQHLCINNANCRLCGEFLHLFSFKTPTLWAQMSEGNVAIWAFSTQNGVRTIPSWKDDKLICKCLNDYDEYYNDYDDYEDDPWYWQYNDP